jgi:hypothetical protein
MEPIHIKNGRLLCPDLNGNLRNTQDNVKHPGNVDRYS